MKQEYYVKYNQSRREFFTKLALASMATTLPPLAIGCSEKPDFQGSGKAPYKVWEEMLHYLKTSPDFLKGRMEVLIRKGDAEAMFNFVRDEIYLIPAAKENIGYGHAFKWGVAYALRSGMATMREKAELLQLMFQKAGITSKVVHERTNITPEEAATFFFRPIKRDFLPEISRGMIRHWEKELGLNETPEISEVLENEAEKAEALGEKVLKQLNLAEDYYYSPFNFQWPNFRTPAVEFEWEGQTKHAHLFDPKIPFGELRSGLATNVRKADEIVPNKQKVQLKLTYRDSITPLIEKELISREWLATDLVGRQLDIQFLNNLSLEEQVVTPVGNVRTFTPAFSLQAMDKDVAFMEERSILADSITLSGKRIVLNHENGHTQIGQSVLLSKTEPNLQKKVKTLEVTAKTTGYPGVKLAVSPLDVQGNMLEGLSAADFNITEDGEPVRALIESNQRTPRVLIMSDTSMSMPIEYRGKGMETFISELKSDILEIYPAAIINFWETPSSLYTWLLKASMTENDLIIYATDGDNNDVYNKANETSYRNGPPAIVLNVKNTTYPSTIKTFEKMASLTGGTHLSVENQKEAQKGIKKYLKNIEIAPYIVTYNSVGTAEKRNVKVEIDSGRVSANASYEVDLDNDEIGPRVIGLYLELKYANQYPIKRTLAGWDHAIHPYDKPSKKMADEVNDFLLGSMQLYFEGAGPTFSAALCDLLEARLSTRKWGEALIENDIEKTKKGYQEGFFSIDDKAMVLMAPLKNQVTSSSFTFPEGLRIGLRTVTPGCMAGTAYSSFDYFQTSEFTTLSKKPKESFSINIKKTAQLAIRENILFQKSTLSELADKTWIDLKHAREQKWFAEHREKDSNYWGERINRGATLRVFDQRAMSKAFWHIDQNTGELIGYLPNGSGGGSDPDHNNIMDGLAKIIEIMSKLKLLHPIGATSLGLVAEYGKLLVVLYAIVSESVMIMDTRGMNQKIKEAIKKFACTAFKAIIFASSGKTGEKFAMLDKLIGALTGKGLGCS